MIEIGPLQYGKMDVRVKSSGKFLGVFYREVDGYFYFHPFESGSGVWSSDALIEIGKELVKLNEDYDKKVSEEFNQVVEEEHQGNRIDNLFDFTDFSADNYRGEDDRLTKDQWISEASDFLKVLETIYSRCWKEREPTDEEHDKIIMEGEESVEGLQYDSEGMYVVRYFDTEEFGVSVDEELIFRQPYGLFDLNYYVYNLKEE